MLTVTQVRTQRLCHHLDEATAATPYDTWWVITRVPEYATTAGITVDVVLDALSYYRRTGMQVDQWWVGGAHVGESGARVEKPVIYLNPRLIPTRGDAEQAIAHEIMHARWSAYGHHKIAFTRAQSVLDTVASMYRI